MIMAKSKEELAKEGAAKAEEKNDKKAKKAEKNKKPNFAVRIWRKIKETFMELKRVTWPTFGKAVKATGVVIGIVLIFTVIVTAMNYGFSELMQLLTSLGGE